MKKLFAIIACSTMLQSVCAQTAESDQRLLTKFSKTELSEMQQNNPEQLAFWEYYVTQGFQVFAITKNASESIMTTLPFSGDVTDINPLTLGLEPEETAVQTYRLGDTGQGLMILSRKKIKARMQRENK